MKQLVSTSKDDVFRKVVKTLVKTPQGDVHIIEINQERYIMKTFLKAKLTSLRQRQVEREIELHSELRHPNIVDMYAHWEDDQMVYLLLEYVADGDLFGHVAGKSLPEGRVAKRVIGPLLEALVYLHARNVIHRDIKLENVLRTSTSIKLADFGLSINYGEERPVTRCGTLEFMSLEVLSSMLKNNPEDFKNDERAGYGFEVDVWACGVMCFELLCGAPPFKARTVMEMKEAIKRGPVIPNMLTDGAASFIQQCLEVDPKKRPTAQALLGHPWILMHHTPIPHRNMPVNSKVMAQVRHGSGAATAIAGSSSGVSARSMRGSTGVYQQNKSMLSRAPSQADISNRGMPTARKSVANSSAANLPALNAPGPMQPVLSTKVRSVSSFRSANLTVDTSPGSVAAAPVTPHAARTPSHLTLMTREREDSLRNSKSTSANSSAHNSFFDPAVNPSPGEGRTAAQNKLPRLVPVMHMQSQGSSMVSSSSTEGPGSSMNHTTIVIGDQPVVNIGDMSGPVSTHDGPATTAAHDKKGVMKLFSRIFSGRKNRKDAAYIKAHDVSERLVTTNARSSLLHANLTNSMTTMKGARSSTKVTPAYGVTGYDSSTSSSAMRDRARSVRFNDASRPAVTATDAVDDSWEGSYHSGSRSRMASQFQSMERDASVSYKHGYLKSGASSANPSAHNGGMYMGLHHTEQHGDELEDEY